MNQHLLVLQDIFLHGALLFGKHGALLLKRIETRLNYLSRLSVFWKGNFMQANIQIRSEPLYLCHQRRIRIFPFQHVKAVGRIRRMDCNLRMEEAGLQTDQQRLIQILQIADQVDEGHFSIAKKKHHLFCFCSGC